MSDEDKSLRIALLAVGIMIATIITSLFSLLMMYYCGCHQHCRTPMVNRLIDAGLGPKLPPGRTNEPERRARTYAENECSTAKNAASTKYKKKKRPQILVADQ